jgi:hypothetical protein
MEPPKGCSPSVETDFPNAAWPPKLQTIHTNVKNLEAFTLCVKSCEQVVLILEELLKLYEIGKSDPPYRIAAYWSWGKTRFQNAASFGG